jgi:hypothetical protein
MQDNQEGPGYAVRTPMIELFPWQHDDVDFLALAQRRREA